jgi:two-component system chemotaxis response regulator CheB
LLAASFGGLAAIRTVLAALPSTFPLPLVMILHRAAGPADPLVQILARSTQLAVMAATDGGRLVPGTAIVLPSHQRVRLPGDGTIRLGARDGSPLAADDVMHDAAVRYGAGALAAVLTGKLSDGAAGAQAMKRAGGTVIVQTPLDCAAPGMPTAALATGCVDHQLRLSRIGPMLVMLTMPYASPLPA